MEISLSGRAAIVTGGSKGLGLAMATQFAASGADVAILARGGRAARGSRRGYQEVEPVRVVGVLADLSKAADSSAAMTK